MAFRTDLAREALAHLSGDCPGVRQSTRTLSGFSVDCVEVLDRAASERLGKPRGVYCTMELDPREPGLPARSGGSFCPLVPAFAAAGAR